jgi:hypothetical protein
MVAQNTDGREANGQGKPYPPLFIPFFADRLRCEDLARSIFATTIYVTTRPETLDSDTSVLSG